MSRSFVLAYALPVLMAVVAALVPVALPDGYHAFADHSAIGGLHPFGDLASNLVFLVAGLFVMSRAQSGPERWLAAALCLTAAGSWYYHLHPSDARLLVDRLPMAPAFAAMAGIILFDGEDRKGMLHTVVLSALFVAAAAYALWSGDQSFWVAAQVYVLLLLVVATVLRPQMRAAALAAFALYVAGKLCETFDHQILRVSGFVSGHTIKHLLAGLAPIFWFALWRREGGRRLASYAV